MNKRDILFICGFVLLFIGVQTCNNVRVDRLRDTLKLTKDSLSSMTEVANRRGETISIQQAEIINSQEVIKKYSDSIFDMKQRYGKILSHTTVKQVVKVKEVLVPYDRTDTLTVRDTLKLTYTTASIDTAGLHASLEVKEDGILIKDISLQNRLDIRVVVNKGGFFKKKQTGGTRTFYKRKSYEVQTRNTSPFFHTEWQTSYTFSPKRDVVTPVVIGFIGGLLIK